MKKLALFLAVILMISVFSFAVSASTVPSPGRDGSETTTQGNPNPGDDVDPISPTTGLSNQPSQTSVILFVVLSVVVMAIISVSMRIVLTRRAARR